MESHVISPKVCDMGLKYRTWDSGLLTRKRRRKTSKFQDLHVYVASKFALDQTYNKPQSLVYFKVLYIHCSLLFVTRIGKKVINIENTLES